MEQRDLDDHEVPTDPNDERDSAMNIAEIREELLIIEEMENQVQHNVEQLPQPAVVQNSQSTAGNIIENIDTANNNLPLQSRIVRYGRLLRSGQTVATRVIGDLHEYWNNFRGEVVADSNAVVDATNDDDDDDDDDDEPTSTQLQEFSLLSANGKSVYAFRPFCLIRCQFESEENPVPRSGHRIVATKSNLYSLGGYNPHSAALAIQNRRCMLLQELWSYNFATHRWKLEMNEDTAKEMPIQLASNALIMCNNIIISYGGTSYPFGRSTSNQCFIYTISSKTQNNSTLSKLHVSGDLPDALYGSGIVLHEHYLYTIGGTTGYTYSCDVYRLDLHSRVWEKLYSGHPDICDDPKGRYRHEVVYDGHHIFLLGGGTSRTVYDLQRIPAYNIKQNCWDYFDTIPDYAIIDGDSYPEPRKCFSCVQHTLANGDIEAFIAGGLRDDIQTYLSDIWKLNLNTKQWTRIRTAELPKPLYFHAAAYSGNGCMYIFGGIEYSETSNRTSDLYKMWITIPKLSDMCWDAITYYNENLHMMDRNILLSAGLPNRYVERLSQ